MKKLAERWLAWRLKRNFFDGIIDGDADIFLDYTTDKILNDNWDCANDDLAKSQTIYLMVC